MCLWCSDASCKSGEKCHNALSKNHLTDSRVFRNACARIQRATGRRVQTAPGVLWDGRRPAFLPGVREAVMGGGDPCGICGGPMSGVGHADHKIPWHAYTQQAAERAMAERGMHWTGGAMPDDFVRVMSSDPQNLQPAHARCNEQKSDSLPGQRAGAARKARREAEHRLFEKRRREMEERMKRQAAAWRKSSLDKCRDWDRRDPDGSDSDPDGGGIPA